ncbi:MAG: endonuclease MutS2, partial [Clostridia bacterium]|nr:endonuclease MutS2 [Clostridia bacterium]
RKCVSDVRDVLSRYTAGSYSKYLQENIVTVRNGRYVVPVRAEYKNEIKGLVHDTSASGQTLFIEPMAVLEANNKLRELRSAESHEIERILARLSEQVTLSADIITGDFNVITDLSVIFGKADYAFAIEAVSPFINENDMTVKLVQARHPLLDKNTVVPISVMLGGRESGTLVITGPNTGGKTVTLKTIGLLAMMTQAGFEIPCDHGTVMPVFDEILPDIGDEQSIEQSLSTFSAHIKNIVGIIKNASNRSLVLYDELGAGTDPTEGAALAIAILEDMRRIGAVTAATTHYAELKTYALETEGVMNASCEFDVETLRPTYRLVTGLPGRSNAFAISTRLGIPDRIIERAKAALSDESVHFEDVIGRLEETESRLSGEKAQAEKLLREAEETLKQARAEKEESERSAAERIAKAEDKAARIMAQAKASSDYIFDELNKLRREAEKEKKFDNIESARKLIRDEVKNSGVKDEEPEEDNYVLPRKLVTGDEVTIRGINKKAVVTAIDGDTVTVRAGIITTKVKMGELRLCEEKPVQKQKSATVYTHPTEAVKNEVDVRGLTGDDAYFVIDRYFESAIMAGYHTVSIIHGKGTGALRNAVWDHLRHDKRVLSFRSGRYGEGDTGVTIVEFK